MCLLLALLAPFIIIKPSIIVPNTNPFLLSDKINPYSDSIDQKIISLSISVQTHVTSVNLQTRNIHEFTIILLFCIFQVNLDFKRSHLKVFVGHF